MSLSTWSDSSALYWKRGVFESVLMCQNEPAEIALQNAVVRTKQFKTVPRNTPRYSHGSLGNCVSAIKEVEKQIRATLFQMCADYNCNSDKFPAEWPIFLGRWDTLHGRSHGTQSKLMGKRHFFKLMSKDHHGEIAEFSELVWFRLPVKQPSWQSNGKKHTRLESQNDLMNIYSRSRVRLFSQSNSEKTL